MKQFSIKVKCSRIPPHIGDVVTPVSIYLTLRDLYPNTVLMESSDYHGNTNSLSFICFNPIADFIVENDVAKCRFPDESNESINLSDENRLTEVLQNFINRLDVDDVKCPVSATGLYGYTSYDAVRYFESVKLDINPSVPHAIPDMRYHLYRSVIAFNHFTNQLFFVEHLYNGAESNLNTLLSVLRNRTVPSFDFLPSGEEKSTLKSDTYRKMVLKGKEHCLKGDLFQIVLSRQFSQTFKGDEFNVYRALRHINPSPYLFFFDYGSYRLFGSSPESQLVVNNGIATINPIAGTFKRTGDDEKDRLLAKALSEDKKENAEHVMLVDLARNDLARSCTDVKVKTLKEIQYYSHVLHIVSEVNGVLKPGIYTPQVMGDTFPAGTLSGAPKYKALELINKYEPHQRGFYGGCIGMMGLDGSFNQAIAIRSFLSKNNTLYYQAGAGVVAESDDFKELDEVNNKLGALKKAIEMAKEF